MNDTERGEDERLVRDAINASYRGLLGSFYKQSQATESFDRLLLLKKTTMEREND